MFIDYQILIFYYLFLKRKIHVKLNIYFDFKNIKITVFVLYNLKYSKLMCLKITYTFNVKKNFNY